MKKIGFSILLTTFFLRPLFALMLPVTIEETVRGAESIVIGKVRSVQSTLEESEKSKTVTTIVKVKVEKTLKGSVSGVVTLTLPGGTVGDFTVWVEHIPTFRENEDVVLFLRTHEGKLWPLYGEEGKYTVRNGVVAKEKMSLEQFTTKISSLVGLNLSFNEESSVQTEKSESAKGISGCNLIY